MNRESLPVLKNKILKYKILFSQDFNKNFLVFKLEETGIKL
jgi:hypothetical protein